MKKASILFALGLLLFCGINVNVPNVIPDFTQNTDYATESAVVIVEGEEVPLAKPTMKTTTKITKKTVKLKSAAKKTYTKKLPASTKTTKKIAKTKKEITTTVTAVKTEVTEKYTKKSKNKVVTTKVTTTVTTTKEVVKETAKKVSTKIKDLQLKKSAPKLHGNLKDAFETLNFTLTMDSGVPYEGYFNARNQSIIVRTDDDATIYHEMGHFLAFLAGNADRQEEFVKIYKAEKSKYTGINKAYVLQNNEEYFAESYKEYVMNPSALKKSRPETYKAIEKALDKVDKNWVKKVKNAYSSVWNF